MWLDIAPKFVVVMVKYSYKQCKLLRLEGAGIEQ